jgi:HSP20 family protein
MAKFLLKTQEPNPFTFMRRITDELDRAFGFKPESPGLQEFYPKSWSPEIEVFERDNKFFVRIDLPGVNKEDVKVEIAHDEITIEGERKFEKEEKEEGYYRTERSYGTFFRRLPLPEHVRAEAAVGTFKNGVLEIEMPAIPIPEAKKRTLELKG